MKKIVIIIVAIVLLGVGYMLILRKSSQPTMPQKIKPQETTSGQGVMPSPSEKILFNTNDNLDQAVQELNQIE